MRPKLRQIAAGPLAAVAVLALVVTPVLHAEVHVREAGQARQERARAFDRVFELVFKGGQRAPADRGELERQLDTVLGSSAAQAHEEDPAAPPHSHGEGSGQPRHTHGPGPHGSASLQHFAAAIHAVAPPPRLPAPALALAEVTLPLIAASVSRIGYLVEQSQGPPRA